MCCKYKRGGGPPVGTWMHPPAGLGLGGGGISEVNPPGLDTLYLELKDTRLRTWTCNFLEALRPMLLNDPRLDFCV